MAIEFDAASSSEHYGTSHSWEHVVGSGSNRLLLVAVSIYQTTARVTGITWGEQEFTFLETRVRGTSIRVELWYLKNPNTGTDDITVTRDNSRVTCGAASYAGVDQTTTFGTVATAASYTSTITVDVSSAADELVVDSGAWQGSITATVGADQTQRWNRLGSPGAIDVGSVGSSEPGAETVTMSWTLSGSANWATIGVPLKPAGEIKEISGAVVAVSTIPSSELSVTREVIGTVEAVCSTSGQIKTIWGLASSIAPLCTTGGSLDVSRKLVVSVACVSTVTGNLIVPAGGFSDFAETHILDHVVGKTSYSKPTVAVGLCIASPTDAGTGGDCNEVANENSYARVATIPADWNTAVAGAIGNANPITFPVATGTWGNVTCYALFDSPVYGEGNMLIYDDLDVPQNVITDTILEFAAGELAINLN